MIKEVIIDTTALYWQNSYAGPNGGFYTSLKARKSESYYNHEINKWLEHGEFTEVKGIKVILDARLHPLTIERFPF